MFELICLLVIVLSIGAVFVDIKGFFKKHASEDSDNFIASNAQNLEKAKLLGKNGIFLGYDIQEGNRSSNPLHYNGDRHIITFGPTGSGKGATAQIPALLDFSSDFSALVIDVKGQLAAITGQARFLNGQEIYIINPFDVLGMPTATYNPLRYLSPSSPSFSADCRKIAEGLIDIEKADHWGLSALDVVTLLIQWTVLYEEEKTLIRVRQLLNQPDKDRILFFETMNGCPRADISEGAARYMSDSKEVKDSIQTAVVQLGFLRDEGIARILQGGGSEISFADLKRKKMTVYLVIPPELLHTHGRFLRLLVMSALAELFREKAQPENPVLFMLDEFAQLGAMPIIENAASIVRDYKIRLWLILQNIPQLKTLYKNKWESFLSSAGVLQFFTPNDMETAEYMSKRSGVYTAMRKSISTGQSTSGAGNNGTSTSTSYSEEIRPNMSIQETFQIAENVQVLFAPGISDNILAWRVPYFMDKDFCKKEGLIKDPYHMTTEEKGRLIDELRGGKTFLNPQIARSIRQDRASREEEKAAPIPAKVIEKSALKIEPKPSKEEEIKATPKAEKNVKIIEQRVIRWPRVIAALFVLVFVITFIVKSIF